MRTPTATRVELPGAAQTGDCPVCPHERDGHDSIASRFCAATSAGALDRGCACAAGSRETRKADQPTSAETVFVSRYEQRVALVRGLLDRDAGLGGSACHALAVRLLRLLDEAPENLRR